MMNPAEIIDKARARMADEWSRGETDLARIAMMATLDAIREPSEGMQAAGEEATHCRANFSGTPETAKRA